MTQCNICDGSGFYKKFEDRDVVEGYKFAPTYPCPGCSKNKTVQQELLDKINKQSQLILAKKKEKRELIQSLSEIQVIDCELCCNSGFVNNAKCECNFGYQQKLLVKINSLSLSEKLLEQEKHELVLKLNETF